MPLWLTWATMCTYRVQTFNFLYPATKKVAGYYFIPSDRLSVRLSALRFLTLTWVVFDRFSSNFAQTLISGRSGLGLQMGHIRLLTTELWPLIDVKMCFFLNIFRTKGWILIKFCVWIDIYMIPVVSNARYFWSIFNRNMALNRRPNFVYAQYLVNFDEILCMLYCD